MEIFPETNQEILSKTVKCCDVSDGLHLHFNQYNVEAVEEAQLYKDKRVLQRVASTTAW